MKKTALLLFCIAFFSATYAQPEYLGKSKTTILNSTTDITLQQLKTDDGMEFLFSEVPDIGQLFLFFSEYDICNTMAIYPVNEEVKNYLASMFDSEGKKEGKNVWSITEDGISQRISLETDSNGKQYFLVLMSE
ncbi:MAG: hypothetical protein LCH52_10585 [Bacteroidetes bacterium]|nr:hypothetical protein [Bacteroidota bacterium]